MQGLCTNVVITVHQAGFCSTCTAALHGPGHQKVSIWPRFGFTLYAADADLQPGRQSFRGTLSDQQHACLVLRSRCEVSSQHPCIRCDMLKLASDINALLYTCLSAVTGWYVVVFLAEMFGHYWL